MTEQNSVKVIPSPIPGKVVEIKARSGDNVKRGDLLLIVEAMKMHNRILTPYDGIVREVKVDLGQAINTNDPLAIIDAN